MIPFLCQLAYQGCAGIGRQLHPLKVKYWMSVKMGVFCSRYLRNAFSRIWLFRYWKEGVLSVCVCCNISSTASLEALSSMLEAPMEKMQDYQTIWWNTMKPTNQSILSAQIQLNHWYASQQMEGALESVVNCIPGRQNIGYWQNRSL